MLVCLFVVAAGYALIFGASGLAERALKIAAGLAIILSFGPGLLSALLAWTRGLQWPGSGAADGIWPLFAVFGLAGLGFFAWRARSLLARRGEAHARRWEGPRERVPPPPSMAMKDRTPTRRG